MADYTERQLRAKEEFFRERGGWKWNDTWETMLHLNHDILAGYSRMSSIPHRRGGISPKEKELIYVAIDNAITHYYTPGFRSHLRHGMCDLGATAGELMEVFALTSTLGTGTYTEGIPILAEELERRGRERAVQLSEAQEIQRERFIKMYGYWNETLEEILAMDEEMFACYLDYMEASTVGNALDDRMRELICIAVHASPTALNREAMRAHIRRALDIGVPVEDIL